MLVENAKLMNAGSKKNLKRQRHTFIFSLQRVPPFRQRNHIEWSLLIQYLCQNVGQSSFDRSRQIHNRSKQCVWASHETKPFEIVLFRLEGQWTGINSFLYFDPTCLIHEVHCAFAVQAFTIDDQGRVCQHLKFQVHSRKRHLKRSGRCLRGIFGQRDAWGRKMRYYECDSEWSWGNHWKLK